MFQRRSLPSSSSEDDSNDRRTNVVYQQSFHRELLVKVIFSQSSDLMERQSSMASSTEEVSGPNNDLSIGSRRDEGATDQFKVFKDFDFLEYESESVEGESTDNFNWGVRRRPLSDGETDKDHSLPPSLSERTPIPSKKMQGVAEESSDDEIGSESPLDEVVVAPEFRSGTSVSGNSSYPPSSLILREHRERHDSGTRSDTSGSSAGDLGDVTPCNASPNLSAMTFHTIMRDDTEETWRAQIQSLLNQFPVSPVELFQLLHRLIRDVTTKAVELTNESCNYLITDSSTAPSTLLGYRLQAISELLNSRVDIPYVWVTSDSLANTRLNESLRFGMLEIQEHWETYLDRKDHAVECADAAKASFKLHMLGESQSELMGNEDILILEMGRSLYKLHFQLRLLIESAHKMVTAFLAVAHSCKLQDISAEISSVKTSLLKVLEESAESDHGTPTPTPSPVPGSDEIETTLIELIQAEKWAAALRHMRHNRGIWSGEIFPCIQYDEDIIGILNVFFKYLSHGKPDTFVVTRSEQDMNETFGHLMENLYLVLKAVNNLESHLKDHGETIPCKTDC